MSNQGDLAVAIQKFFGSSLHFGFSRFERDVKIGTAEFLAAAYSQFRLTENEVAELNNLAQNVLDAIPATDQPKR